MLVKKFKSETFEDALKEVKLEMGPEAIVLSKKVVRDPNRGMLGLLGKPLVELTAAIDSRFKKNKNNEINLPAPGNSEVKAARSVNVSKKASAARNIQDIVSLSGAARSLKKRNRKAEKAQ